MRGKAGAALSPCTACSGGSGDSGCLTEQTEEPVVTDQRGWDQQGVSTSRMQASSEFAPGSVQLGSDSYCMASSQVFEEYTHAFAHVCHEHLFCLHAC